jgi:hypothetical protein
MIQKTGCRFPACAKFSQSQIIQSDASAGEDRSEKIMLEQQAKAKSLFYVKPFRFSEGRTAMTTGHHSVPASRRFRIPHRPAQRHPESNKTLPF